MGKHLISQGRWFLPTGNQLRAASSLAGLKAVELAALADIDQSTISRMENVRPQDRGR